MLENSPMNSIDFHTFCRYILIMCVCCGWKLERWRLTVLSWHFAFYTCVLARLAGWHCDWCICVHHLKYGFGWRGMLDRWVFPKIGVPPNHVKRFFHYYKPSILEGLGPPLFLG